MKKRKGKNQDSVGWDAFFRDAYKYMIGKWESSVDVLNRKEKK